LADTKKKFKLWKFNYFHHIDNLNLFLTML
jgi:hypothetical protein